ncbi:MAG: 50S ribosomal protein L25/general stress protein Ctc, partial [Pseudomonadota bacterium]
MAEGFALKADVRERTGKGAARALRRTGFIPAVIYGNNEPPTPIAIPFKEMTFALNRGGFLTNVWSIDVGGKTHQALARDYQRDPVKDTLVHVDFLRVDAKSRVTVEVPLSFVGENDSPGLVAGGVLNVVTHTVPLECPATAIPDTIEVSVAGLEIGATITSEDLVLTGDIALAGQGDAFPVATIAAPVAEVEEEPEAEVAPDEVPADARVAFAVATGVGRHLIRC